MGYSDMGDASIKMLIYISVEALGSLHNKFNTICASWVLDLCIKCHYLASRRSGNNKRQDRIYQKNEGLHWIYTRCFNANFTFADSVEM